MLRLLIIVTIAISYFFGRFHSDWVYSFSGVNIASDPDRILGVLAFMTTGPLVMVVVLMLVAIAAKVLGVAKDQPAHKGSSKD